MRAEVNALKQVDACAPRADRKMLDRLEALMVHPPWVKPQHNRAYVRKAGKMIVGVHRQSLGTVPTPEDFFDATEVMLAWRSAHALPLNAVQMTLRRKARGVDETAIVAQRLKRFPSIYQKLARFPAMKLDTMQDIAGCRAIMNNVAAVRAVEDGYLRSGLLAPRIEDRRKDYIAKPKSNGYRGVHLVFRYAARSEGTAAWNGLQVEIQLRSRLQHAWAAAVETVDLFTHQSMKTGSGTPDWERFMALMSSWIAMEEQQPLIPGTPTDVPALSAEIRAMHDALE